MKTFEIIADEADSHFSTVRIVGKRGKILSEHRILTSDAAQWRRYLEEKGEHQIIIKNYQNNE